MRDEFDDIIQRRLRSFEEDPSRDRWFEIARRLQKSSHSLLWLNQVMFFAFLTGVLVSMSVPQEDIVPNFDIHPVRQDSKSITCIDQPVTWHVNHLAPTVSAADGDHTSTNSPDLDPMLVFDSRIHTAHLTYITRSASMIPSWVRPVAPSSQTKPLTRAIRVKGRGVHKKQLFTRYPLYLNVMPGFANNGIETNVNDNITVKNSSTLKSSRDALALKIEVGSFVLKKKKYTIATGISYYQRHRTLVYFSPQLEFTTATTANGNITQTPSWTYVKKSHPVIIKNIGIQAQLLRELKRQKKIQKADDALSSTGLRTSQRRFAHFLGVSAEFQKPLGSIEIPNQASSFKYPASFFLGSAFYRLEYPREGKWKLVLQPTFSYAYAVNKRRDAPFTIGGLGSGFLFGFRYSVL
jgi:hypothetical protein